MGFSQGMQNLESRLAESDSKLPSVDYQAAYKQAYETRGISAEQYRKEQGISRSEYQANFQAGQVNQIKQDVRQEKVDRFIEEFRAQAADGKILNMTDSGRHNKISSSFIARELKKRGLQEEFATIRASTRQKKNSAVIVSNQETECDPQEEDVVRAGTDSSPAHYTPSGVEYLRKDISLQALSESPVVFAKPIPLMKREEGYSTTAPTNKSVKQAVHHTRYSRLGLIGTAVASIAALIMPNLWSCKQHDDSRYSKDPQTQQVLTQNTHDQSQVISQEQQIEKSQKGMRLEENLGEESSVSVKEANESKYVSRMYHAAIAGLKEKVSSLQSKIKQIRHEQQHNQGQTSNNDQLQNSTSNNNQASTDGNQGKKQDAYAKAANQCHPYVRQMLLECTKLHSVYIQDPDGVFKTAHPSVRHTTYAAVGSLQSRSDIETALQVIVEKFSLPDVTPKYSNNTTSKKETLWQAKDNNRAFIQALSQYITQNSRGMGNEKIDENVAHAYAQLYFERFRNFAARKAANQFGELWLALQSEKQGLAASVHPRYGTVIYTIDKQRSEVPLEQVIGTRKDKL